MRFFIFFLPLIISTCLRAQCYFSPPVIFSTSNLQSSCNTITAGDIDGDGDKDVVSAIGRTYKLVWYQNLDGAGNFSAEKIIGGCTDNILSLNLTDFDNDGDLDLLYVSGCPSFVCWFKNADGLGHFSPRIMIYDPTWNLSAACVADVDQDGNTDIIITNFDDGHILWFRNTDGLGNFELQPAISTSVYGVNNVITADVDGDADPDVISGAMLGEYIAWQENPGGQGTFGDQNVISDTSMTAKVLVAADLDGDSDMDLASANSDGKLFWFENLDAQGNFGPRTFIGAFNISSLVATDIDSDGDVDLVGNLISHDKIVCVENENHGNFICREVSHDVESPSSLFTADMDGDDDADILTSSYNMNEIEWLKNFNLRILTQPMNFSSCISQPVSFSTSARDYSGFHWQSDMGTGFMDLVNDNLYSGVKTAVLTIAATSPPMTGFRYRCRVWNDHDTLFTDEATLIIGDHLPPAISGDPGDQIIYANDQCNAILADYSASITASDSCDANPIIIQIPPPGTPVSGEFNTITLTAKDHSYNQTSIHFNVAVHDSIAPVIICPASKTIELVPGKDFFTISDNDFDPVSVTDNCQIKSITNDLSNTGTLQNQVIPAGKTIIHWMITDLSGNQSSCSDTIIVKTVKWDFSVYPNPTSGKLYFNFPGYDVISVTVMNIEGKQLLERTLNPVTDNIDISHFPDGLYFILVVAGDNVIIRKIVKV